MIFVIIVIVVLVFIFAFRVRNDDNFGQDFVKLVTTRLLIPSPLDQIVETETLNRFPSIDIACFSEQLVISRVVVSDVSKNSKLNTT